MYVNIEDITLNRSQIRYYRWHHSSSTSVTFISM